MYTLANHSFAKGKTDAPLKTSFQRQSSFCSCWKRGMLHYSCRALEIESRQRYAQHVSDIY